MSRSRLLGNLLLLVLIALFVRLGMWQLSRAGEKHAAHQIYSERLQLPALRLDYHEQYRRPADQLLWRAMEMTGKYLPGSDVVLDNQSYHGQPGYLVFTPFILGEGGAAVLVNRGWIPMAGTREQLDLRAAPTEEREIQGRIATPPAHGISLAGDARVEVLADGVRRVQKIDIPQLSALLRIALLPHVVRLDPSAADGFVRDWQPPADDEDRNRAYAVQWFAFAIMAFVIIVVSTLKNRL